MAIMTYREAAENAAAVERVGNYAHASVLWKEAAENTANAINLEWCANRADTCLRLHQLRKEGK